MQFFFILLLLSLNSFAKDLASTEIRSQYPIEEVVAIGVRPGPELWKVTKGENVLWILGTLSPLPKKMTWHTTIVETIMADSQALILYPSVTSKIGFFQGLSLATSAIGIRKNPNKQLLKDVLPAKMYARWLTLKQKYMGRDKGVEKLRPLFAAEELFEKALKIIGLKSKTKIVKKVRKIAKKNKLEIITPLITLELNKPKAAIKKFKKSKISDIECFSKTLEKLEFNLETLRQRAFAWAYGDINKLRSLPIIDNNRSCMNAILKSQIIQDVGMSNIESRVRDIWLKEVKASLEKNKSTFAVLSINNLLGDNSYLNDLEAQGYSVKVPK